MSSTLICAATNPGDDPWLPGSGAQGSLHSWLSWDYNNQRESSWQDTTLGHYIFNRLKHIPSLPMKEVYLLILEFQPEGQVWHTPRAYGANLTEQSQWMLSLHSPSTLLQLVSISGWGRGGGETNKNKTTTKPTLFFFSSFKLFYFCPWEYHSSILFDPLISL